MFKINNEEMQDVWTIPAVGMKEKKFGYHPTQKPEALLERIIMACSNNGDVVLDPFCGSGTTCYVAKKLKRNYIGIEKNEKLPKSIIQLIRNKTLKLDNIIYLEYHNRKTMTSIS